MKKMKPEVISMIIKGASVLLGLAGAAVADKIEKNHRDQMKADIIKELSEKK